jgi:hypothetical protein
VNAGNRVVLLQSCHRDLPWSRHLTAAFVPSAGLDLPCAWHQPATLRVDAGGERRHQHSEGTAMKFPRPSDFFIWQRALPFSRRYHRLQVRQPTDAAGAHHSRLFGWAAAQASLLASWDNGSQSDSVNHSLLRTVRAPAAISAPRRSLPQMATRSS